MQQLDNPVSLLPRWEAIDELFRDVHKTIIALQISFLAFTNSWPPPNVQINFQKAV